MFGATREILIATAYGIFALISVSIIRRFALGAVGTAAIAAPALCAAILLLAYYPAERGTSVPLAFTAASDPSPTALSERVFYDAPLVATRSQCHSCAAFFSATLSLGIIVAAS